MIIFCMWVSSYKLWRSCSPMERGGTLWRIFALSFCLSFVCLHVLLCAPWKTMLTFHLLWRLISQIKKQCPRSVDDFHGLRLCWQTALPTPSLPSWSTMFGEFTGFLGTFRALRKIEKVRRGRLKDPPEAVQLCSHQPWIHICCSWREKLQGIVLADCRV